MFHKAFPSMNFRRFLEHFNEDFLSVERLYEVEKFQLDRKIFSSWEIKDIRCTGFERMTLLILLSDLIHYTTRV